MLMSRATSAAALLKALGHEKRLLILCHLAGGEMTVAELEEALELRQAIVSQHLTRLRLEGLVVARRSGKANCYRLTDARTAELLDCVEALFRDGAPSSTD
ncbi:metalloregulator ArsR/SmtB family transcription factor [Aquicoccus sp. SCR17]|nr:metalloregulator ArsR/SmtB family transcription factor [Carideicomes alvinocaridis]